MNKKIIFLVFSFLILISLSACSSGNTANTTANVNTSDSANRRPDFGQPERQADIRGIVKSIVGNEVTILEIEMGSGRGQASSTEGTINRPTVSLTGETSGPPAGGRGMGMGGGPDSANTDRSEMLARLKEMSTGEVKVTIPVGIRMLKSSSNNNQREMLEANLSDISADKNLMIWLDPSISDRKVAEFVLIN